MCVIIDGWRGMREDGIELGVGIGLYDAFFGVRIHYVFGG